MNRARILLVCCLLLAVAGPVAARPNVLFVLTDDQRFDTIHALGNSEIQTPTLDALVERGFTFSNAYCQGGNVSAVCIPSRTQLLSGKSVFRTPAPNLKTYDGATLGRVFRSAGYATLCVSKPGNSFRAAHDHFETVVHIPHIGAETNKKCADAVLDFLKAGGSEKPFFIYLAPSMPHDPRTAEPEFHKLYDPARITLSKNFMAETPIDFGVLDIRDEKLAAYPRKADEMRRHVADYYACITSLDHHLGRILDALKASKRLDDTVILFTSDQGLAVGGRHGLMGKQNLYEHFKSPLLLAGPGVPKGKSPALVYLYDLFPTACELSGLAIPTTCDGASLVPVLKGERASVRGALFLVFIDSVRMVRDERWKLLWYPKLGKFQLFDLRADPDELTNLTDKAEHAETLATLKKRMAEEQEHFGDKLERPR
jgi:arylsulfatase A-like enzyme